MIAEFDTLTSEEKDLMLKTPLLVSVLIAGADDNIDKTEIREAVSIAKLKQKKARVDLIEYYKEIANDFEDKLKMMIDQFPKNSETRNPIIIAELEQLNSILPKLNKTFATEFYASIKDFAKKVAEASGGLLGYMAVGYEESKLIGLEMIKDPSK